MQYDFLKLLGTRLACNKIIIFVIQYYTLKKLLVGRKGVDMAPRPPPKYATFIVYVNISQMQHFRGRK